MLKLNNIFRFILTIIIFLGSFYYFSEFKRINNLSGWLQLIIGGGVLTPLVTYAWSLKSKFEKLIESEGLNSVQTDRLSKIISIFIKKIGYWMLFYVFSAGVIFLLQVFKDEIEYARYLASLTVALLFIAVLSFISLRDFDISLTELKSAIIIRRKKNAEKEALINLLNADDKFSDKEKEYFNRYNKDD
ncbi:hypothetical protein [Siccibacter turicensis]|uniref:hypothetical protein n=1 Tax=Siccibacter turicensis TaxID=357233 RepID=UPI00101EF83B|nr:hypothetical protein [Siccibacter turicensis]